MSERPLAKVRVDEGAQVSIRFATPADAAALARLISELGFASTAEQIERRLPILFSTSEAPLVADEAGLVGCLTWHVTPVLHRPGPVGRITMLIVANAWRGRGVGRGLVAAAEAELRMRGCALVEITSNLKLESAHKFYKALGYEVTSLRFAKTPF
jgi:ribosomal protein S18 acetylase RimI-like enzyme